jgi:hypothetical protein
MRGTERKGRKLLIATLGLAAVSYVGCEDENSSVANLMAPIDSGMDANDAKDARDARDVIVSPRDVVANLVAPDLGLE